MKNKFLIIGIIIVISLLVLMSLQVFAQPKIVDGNQIELQKTYTHHKNEVWEVKFSPNDSLMISGGIEPNAKIWSRITGEVLHDLPHEIGTPTVDFSSTGKVVATGAYDGNVRIWDVKTRALLKTLKGNGGTVWTVNFSSNGKLLASAGDDKTVKIWDTTNWQLLHTLKEDNQAIHSVIFIDNDRVIAGGTDKSMIGELLEYHFKFSGVVKPIVATLWDVKSEKILQTISNHTNDIGLGMDVSSDGKLIATPSKDKTVKVWKII